MKLFGFFVAFMLGGAAVWWCLLFFVRFAKNSEYQRIIFKKMTKFAAEYSLNV